MNFVENKCFNTIKILSNNDNALNVLGGTNIKGNLICNKIKIDNSEIFNNSDGIIMNNNIIPDSDELTLGNNHKHWDNIFTNEIKIFGFAYCNYLNVSNLNVEENVSLGKIEINENDDNKILKYPLINLNNKKIEFNFDKLVFNNLRNKKKIEFNEILNYINKNNEYIIDINKIQKNNCYSLEKDKLILNLKYIPSEKLIIKSDKFIIINIYNNREIILGTEKKIFVFGNKDSTILLNLDENESTNDKYIVNTNINIIFDGNKWIKY